MAEKGEWTHVRLRAETAARIKAEATQLVAFYLENIDRQPEGFEVRDNWNPGFVGMSMDDMVNLLLDARQNKRDRSNRSKKRTRKVDKGVDEGEGD